MKIMFFIHSLQAGGAERVVTILASFWKQQGHQVSIVTLESTDKDFFRIEDGVGRTTLGLANSPPAALGKLWMTVHRILHLRAEIRRQSPDVAISLMDTSNVLLALAGVGLRGTVRIGSERTYSPAAKIGRIWRFLRRVTYRFLHGVVAQTQENADWLRRNTSARQVWIVPNPVATPLERREPIVNPDPKVLPRRLLTVGAYVSEKAFEILVESFSLIASRFPSWELAIVGDGPVRPLLESRIRETGLAKQVRLVGIVGNPADWYASADLFVLSSRFEGFPNALLEAMAYGLPVVATDCMTGPRALVREDIDGLIVPPESASELAKALSVLMADDNLRARYAKNAREGSIRFSVEIIAARWMRIVEQESESMRKAGLR